MEHVVTNQYERIQKHSSDAGVKALPVMNGTEKCQLCHIWGYPVLKCRSSQGANRQHPSKFIGQCFACGKLDHRADERRGTKVEGTKEGKSLREIHFTGSCVCGDEGHTTHKCDLQKRNK